MSGLKDFIIKNGVLEKHKGRESDVTVPSGVVIIKDKAFAKCTSLRSVRISDSVEWIGGHAFKGCTGLQSITLGNGVKSIMRSAFFGCTNLTEITLPESLEFIGYRIFECCINLRKIHAPNGLPNLTEASEDFLIKLCLSGIEIENESLRKKLRKYIKRNRDELFKKALYEDSLEIVMLILSMYDRVELDLLDQMIGLANERQNAAITSLLVDYKNKNYTSDDLESIENEKTEKELGLRDRTPSDWRKIFKITYWEGSAYIGGCKSEDETVEIPSIIGKTKVNGIAHQAFRFDHNIKKVIMSEGVTAIGDEAFKCCSGLVEIILPNSMRHIGCGAFEGCTSLTSVIIPDGVTEIGWSAFASCSNLTSVTIPDSVTEIGWGTFAWCPNLTSVYFTKNTLKIDANAFFKSKAVFYGPAGCYAEQYAKESGIKFVAM